MKCEEAHDSVGAHRKRQERRLFRRLLGYTLRGWNILFCINSFLPFMLLSGCIFPTTLGLSLSHGKGSNFD